MLKRLAGIFGRWTFRLKEGGDGIRDIRRLRGRRWCECDDGQRQHKWACRGPRQGADDPSEHEEDYTQTERPSKALNRSRSLAVGGLLLGQAVEDGLDGIAVEWLGAELEKASASGGGKLLQHTTFQPRTHHIARVIANIVALNFGIGNERAAFGADTDRDDDNTRGGEALDVGHEVGVGIAAVTENHQRVVALGQCFDRTQHHIQQIAEIAAAPFDDGVVEGLQGLDDGVVIGRQRGLKISATCKRQQTDAFTGKFDHHIMCGQSCAGETIRRHIAR